MKNQLVTKDMIETARKDAMDLDMKNEACKTMHNFAVQLKITESTAEKYPHAYKMASLIENGITEVALENWLLNEWWK